MPFEPRVWSALLWATSVLVLFTSLAPARADPIADFYSGKTVYLLIGVGVGGEYDLQARLIARHLGRHIPGNPAIVPQNMTGASGLKEFNYLANVAPKDGTYIGIIQNALPAMQAVGLDGVQFDATKFFWLGTMAPVVETMAVWHTTGVTSIEGARGKQIVAGSTARGSITYTYRGDDERVPRHAASRSSPATPAATRSTSPWSAARSKRATIHGRAGRRRTRPGSPRKSSR